MKKVRAAHGTNAARESRGARENRRVGDDETVTICYTIVQTFFVAILSTGGLQVSTWQKIAYKSCEQTLD